MRTRLLLFLVILVTNSLPYLRKLDTEESCKNNGKDFEVIFQSTCTIAGKTSLSSSEDDCINDNGTFSPAKGRCVEKTSNSDKTNDKTNSKNNSFNSFISFKFGLIFITYLLF